MPAEACGCPARGQGDRGLAIWITDRYRSVSVILRIWSGKNFTILIRHWWSGICWTIKRMSHCSHVRAVSERRWIWVCSSIFFRTTGTGRGISGIGRICLRDFGSWMPENSMWHIWGSTPWSIWHLRMPREKISGSLIGRSRGWSQRSMNVTALSLSILVWREKKSGFWRLWRERAARRTTRHRSCSSHNVSRSIMERKRSYWSTSMMWLWRMHLRVDFMRRWSILSGRCSRADSRTTTVLNLRRSQGVCACLKRASLQDWITWISCPSGAQILTSISGSGCLRWKRCAIIMIWTSSMRRSRTGITGIHLVRRTFTIHGVWSGIYLIHCRTKTGFRCPTGRTHPQTRSWKHWSTALVTRTGRGSKCCWQAGRSRYRSMRISRTTRSMKRGTTSGISCILQDIFEK